MRRFITGLVALSVIIVTYFCIPTWNKWLHVASARMLCQATNVLPKMACGVRGWFVTFSLGNYRVCVGPENAGAHLIWFSLSCLLVVVLLSDVRRSFKGWIATALAGTVLVWTLNFTRGILLLFVGSALSIPVKELASSHWAKVLSFSLPVLLMLALFWRLPSLVGLSTYGAQKQDV